MTEFIKTADGSITLSHQGSADEGGEKELYHSHSGAYLEAQALFMDASGFKDSLNRRQRCIIVWDIGLGLGYNALSTIDAWMLAAAPPDLELFSIENDFASFLRFMESSGNPFGMECTSHWRQYIPDSWFTDKKDILHATLGHKNTGSTLRWTCYCMDFYEVPFSRLGNDLVTGLSSKANYIWYDPFSPKKNPSLWTPEAFSLMGEGIEPGAVLMTYSVSRAVKDALQAAGWQYRLIPTTTQKRNWMKAIKT